MKKLIFFLFFLSGAAGLIYQIVWARQLVLIFGNTTYSTTTVVSVFMGGLALGSLVFGYYSEKIKDLIKTWAKLEIGIGLLSLVTLYLIINFPKIYLPVTLLEKFLFSVISILPTTFLMGGTLPILIKKFHKEYKNLSEETSKLYFFNTFGAFVGTIVVSFFLIELVGLTAAALSASVLNICIGFTGYFLIRDKQIVSKQTKVKNEFAQTYHEDYKKPIIYFALLTFFLSGALSLSYEILWTRILIPSLGTYTYAFSTILIVILLGIALGSAISRILVKKYQKTLSLYGVIEFLIGVFAISSIYFSSADINLPKYIKLLVATIPASIAMGATFPVFTNLFQKQKNSGFLVGISYAVNTAGSIIGPIITGFILIPLIGTNSSIILFSAINMLMGVVLIFLEGKKLKKISILLTFIAILVVSLPLRNPNNFIELNNRRKLEYAKEKGWEYKIYEDEVATTLAYGGKDGSPDEKGLVIDGVHTTTLTNQTKLLAHFPLLIHSNPKNMLIIAFGMGTTYRSALTHNIEVDAVELVPSVPKAFPLFFQNAVEVLNNPEGKIYINDGRNYLLTTNKKYDIIVSDPPPPINAAGTTVLYSKEFYRDAKDNLNEGGLLVQWFWYGASEDDFKMLFASFRESFDYILVALTPEGTGCFFFGSDKPITIDKNMIIKRYTGDVYKDFNEWKRTPMKVDEILQLFVGDEKTIDRFIGNANPVTDNNPKTEYFYLRHKLFQQPQISADWPHPISPEFFQKYNLKK